MVCNQVQSPVHVDQLDVLVLGRPTALNWRLHAYGEQHSEWGWGKQASLGAFILNRVLHFYKSILEALAESLSRIKDLYSLYTGGGNARSYRCPAVNKISPGMKHFNLKWFYQEQLTNLSRKLAVLRGTSIPIGKGLWKELMKVQNAALTMS